ncbi:Rieske (2Fe-2S) protein [Kitasatospora sp. McL0602]|uniref:Rieske (2Fe-2S) protein n=1 Tax=Kitasatospora sp. McL0602 TaxID=3439530 RepID=UPI003F89C6BE
MTENSGTTSRRTLLCGAAAALATGGAVAGCGSAASSSSNTASGTASKSPKQPPAPVEVGAAADVPVGGGKIFAEHKIVVTQPTAGQFKAFSARCTHAGCLVDQVKNNQIQCPCHGSRFGIADGAVQDGPAPEPLPAYQVAVADGKITVTPAQ